MYSCEQGLQKLFMAVTKGLSVGLHCVTHVLVQHSQQVEVHVEHAVIHNHCLGECILAVRRNESLHDLYKRRLESE